MEITRESFSSIFGRMLMSKSWHIIKTVEYLRSKKYSQTIKKTIEEDEDEIQINDFDFLGTIGDCDMRLYSRTSWCPNDNEDYEIDFDLYIEVSKSKQHNVNFRVDIYLVDETFLLSVLKGQVLELTYNEVIVKCKESTNKIYDAIVRLRDFKNCSTKECSGIIPNDLEVCFHCECQMDKTEDCFCLDCEKNDILIQLPCCNKIIHKECYDSIVDKDKSELNKTDKKKLERSKFVLFEDKDFKVCPFCREFLQKEYSSKFKEYNKYEKVKII